MKGKGSTPEEGGTGVGVVAVEGFEACQEQEEESVGLLHRVELGAVAMCWRSLGWAQGVGRGVVVF